MIMTCRRFIVLFLLTSFPAFADWNDFNCPMEELYGSFGYDVGLIERSSQVITNLNNMRNTQYVFMSPDDIKKFDLAIIYSNVLLCVRQIKKESICVHLKENSNEVHSLMACNWYVEDGVVKGNQNSEPTLMHRIRLFLNRNDDD